MNILKRIYRKIHHLISKRNHESIKSKEQLFKELMKYQVISFDIFDTLITRKIFNPDDIFNLMETRLTDVNLKDSMLNMRKKAEKQAREKLNVDVNIDEIYDELGKIYGYNEKTVQKMKKTEIDLELELIVPRHDMLDILKNLMNNGKKVILTSDMYLTKDIILKLLLKCGYKENVHFKRFYLSNDKNMRKDDASLWKYIKILYLGMKFVHVGDNVHSDYNIPIQMGLNAINIMNPREQLRKNNLCQYLNPVINNRNNSDSLLLGYVINAEIFNSPFSNEINSLDMFAKVFIAPMIFELVQYIDLCSESNEQLLFLAREGYNLQKLYKEYCKIFGKKEKSNYYFLASRRATMTALFENDDDIKNSLNRDYSGDLCSLLKSVFDIDYRDSNLEITLPKDSDMVWKNICFLSNNIITKSKEYKKSYMKYIDTLLSSKNNIRIVDLGYSGTIQFNLSKMLKKDLKGIYLTNSESVKKYTNKSELLFCYDNNDNNEYSKIFNYSLILEYFLSAPFGQLLYFQCTGDEVVPVYNDEKMDNNQIQNNKCIYDAVCNFFEYVYSNKSYTDFDSKELVFQLYRGIVESGIISKRVKDEFDFMDAFNNNSKSNIFKTISKY